MDRLILFNDGKVYEADAVASGGEVEGKFGLRIMSKAFAPAGQFGDVVFRRASVTITHTAGFHVRITPILDGGALYGSTTDFSSTHVPLNGETVVLDVPIARRGSTIQLFIETVPHGNKPFYGPVHVETVQIVVSSGHAIAPMSNTGTPSAGGRRVGS